MPYTALLDANVLVPYTLTDILLRLSEAGFFRPLWTTEVLAETERTLAHLYPDVDSSRFHDRLAAMDLFFTDATVTGWESLLDSIELPDPDDRHVVAAAVVGGADAIITANLTDFTDDTLAAFDIVAVHPDTFLLDQWDLDPTLARRFCEIPPPLANDPRPPWPPRSTHSASNRHPFAHANPIRRTAALRLRGQIALGEPLTTEAPTPTAAVCSDLTLGCRERTAQQ
ncbi:MAG: PIN domain-containing protein [Mycobacteriaceae bacterium]